MPGVQAVLTGDDYKADGLGSLPSMAPYKKRDGTPMYLPERPAIAVGRAMHVGYPVAVVVADTLELARDAAERVAVDYNPLPAVVSARDAFERNLPLLAGVRANYRRQAHAPDWQLIDGRQSVDEVAAAVSAAVRSRLATR